MRHIGILAIAALLVGAADARAQDNYPSQTVKFVVPAAPGSTTDTLARLVADGLARKWGKPTVVENIAGGGMNIGATAVARAAPDGHTLLVAPPAPLTISHLLANDLNYSPSTFVPITMLAKISNVLLVRRTLPANSMKELIDYAKANPGKLTYASQGVGASGHVAAELFKLQTGTDIVHVPYKGAAPAAQDLAAGHVNMMFDVVSLALGPIQAGRVRPLGVTTRERTSVLPDVPTMIEQGMQVEIGAWFGFLAPAGTPQAAITWLNREANKVLSVDDARGRFVRTGAAVPLGTPESFARFIEAESNRYGEVIRRAGIKIEQQ